MTLMNRRAMLRSACGIGALLTLPASEIFAQVTPRFVPLELSGRGRAMLNPQVSTLDADEDRLLDDLLAGNLDAGRRDLRAIDGDVETLLRNPGRPVSYEATGYRREAARVQTQVNVMLGSTLHRQNLFGVVQLIDLFVGHWYPCNDIYEIGVCQRRIWDTFGPRCDLRVIEFYSIHMRYEMQSLFRYHGRSGPFGTQSAGLVQVLHGVETMAVRGDYMGCRTEFQRFSMATDLIFRKYYPEWC